MEHEKPRPDPEAIRTEFEKSRIADAPDSDQHREALEVVIEDAEFKAEKDEEAERELEKQRRRAKESGEL